MNRHNAFAYGVNEIVMVSIKKEEYLNKNLKVSQEIVKNRSVKLLDQDVRSRRVKQSRWSPVNPHGAFKVEIIAKQGAILIGAN